jgi:hypothetical protein
MTGKYLGKVNAAADVSASLKAAGYAKGAYIVRGQHFSGRIQLK